MKVKKTYVSSAAGLCARCHHREEVASKEQGVVHLRCRAFRRSLYEMGEVEDCTAFHSVDDAHLFVHDAWMLVAIPGTDEKKFMTPGEDYDEFVERWQKRLGVKVNAAPVDESDLVADALATADA